MFYSQKPLSIEEGIEVKKKFRKLLLEEEKEKEYLYRPYYQRIPKDSLKNRLRRIFYYIFIPDPY